MISELEQKIIDCLSPICDCMIYITDMKQQMTKITRSALDLFDLPGEDTFNIIPRWRRLIHPEDLQMFHNTYQGLVQGEVPKIKCEYRARTRYNKYVKVRHQVVAMHNDYGEIVSLIGTVSCIDNESRYDTITGLPNVHEFHNALGQICETNVKSALLIFGLDNFSYVNKIYGYSFGNDILRSFAKSILNSMNHAVRLYRLDGDKFGLVFQGGNKNDIRRCYSIIKKIAETPYEIKNRNIIHTVSAGAVLYPDNGQNKETLYRNLDNALQEAKLGGKNKIVYFSDELADKESFSLRLLDALKDSVDNDFKGFELYYQALIDAHDDKLYGCEALLRWNHPDFPQVGPNVFVPLLEESGMIDEVGHWIVTAALSQLKEWLEVMPDFKMNINVSYLQFVNPQFKYYVVEQLKIHDIRPASVILELTESCKITDVRALQKELRYLRDNGIMLALDDFGMGYSSLGVLRELEADMVKLDHSFVLQIADSALDKAIIENIVNICHTVNILVCVEGIENETIYNIVSKYKPDSLQGYHFGRPIPADKFNEQFLK